MVREAPVSQIKRPRCPLDKKVILLSVHVGELGLEEEEREASSAAAKIATGESLSEHECVGSDVVK